MNLPEKELAESERDFKKFEEDLTELVGIAATVREVDLVAFALTFREAASDLKQDSAVVGVEVREDGCEVAKPFGQSLAGHNIGRIDA